jgi:hypothetical protein
MPQRPASIQHKSGVTQKPDHRNQNGKRIFGLGISSLGQKSALIQIVKTDFENPVNSRLAPTTFSGSG